MDIFSLYPSNFLRAADLKGQTRPVIIVSVAPEELADGTKKPVVRLQGIQQGLVLNKTNAMVIANAYGTETANWVGKGVELFVEPVQFNGRLVDSIRARIPADVVPADQSENSPAPASENQGDVQW